MIRKDKGMLRKGTLMIRKWILMMRKGGMLLRISVYGDFERGGISSLCYSMPPWWCFWYLNAVRTFRLWQVFLYCDLALCSSGYPLFTFVVKFFLCVAQCTLWWLFLMDCVFLCVLRAILRLSLWLHFFLCASVVVSFLIKLISSTPMIQWVRIII